MKSGKKGLYLLLGGIFIILACTMMPESLFEEFKFLNGQYGMNKVTISAKLIFQDNSKLKPDNIKKLARAFKSDDFSYSINSGAENVPVKAGGRNITAAVTGTNYMLPGFYRCNMLQGSFLTEASEKEGGYIAVVDDRFAWNVFMTDDAVGKTLELYDKTFRIVGVLKADESIISRLAGNNTPKVYIPGNKMVELNKEASVGFIQLRTSDTSTMGKNTGLISKALQAEGYKPTDFSITDMNITRALMEQKSEIIVFLLSCIMIIYILRWVLHLLKDLVAKIVCQCRTDYLLTVLKANILTISLASIKVLSAAFSIYLLLVYTAFKPYIPSEYLPEDLIDIKFYFELLISHVSEAVGNPDHLHDITGVMLNGVGFLTGEILVLLTLAGLLLVYTGLSALDPKIVKVSGITLSCGLFMLISVALQALITNAMGLPYVPEIGNILVIWAFISISIWFKFFKYERMNFNNE